MDPRPELPLSVHLLTWSCCSWTPPSTHSMGRLHGNGGHAPCAHCRPPCSRASTQGLLSCLARAPRHVSQTLGARPKVTQSGSHQARPTVFHQTLAQHTHVCTHTDIHTRIYTQTQTHTDYTYIHMQTYTHRRVHTHAHTHAEALSGMPDCECESAGVIEGHSLEAGEGVQAALRATRRAGDGGPAAPGPRHQAQRAQCEGLSQRKGSRGGPAAQRCASRGGEPRPGLTPSQPWGPPVPGERRSWELGRF